MPRKKAPEPIKENNERWLLTYADLITLLLVFFIILYAFSQVDQTKFSQLALALQRAFNVGVLEGQISTGSIVGQGGTVGQIEISDIQYIQNQVGKDLSAQHVSNDVSIGNRQEGLVITISGQVLFGSGDVKLDPNGEHILSTLANSLRAAPNDIRVEGYSDDIPFHSDQYLSNWELSAARALAVLHYFIDKGQVDPSRLSAAGYGPYHNVAPNDSAEDRAKNRRVEIVVLKSGAGLGAATPTMDNGAVGPVLGAPASPDQSSQ